MVQSLQTSSDNNFRALRNSAARTNTLLAEIRDALKGTSSNAPQPKARNAVPEQSLASATDALSEFIDTSVRVSHLLASDFTLVRSCLIPVSLLFPLCYLRAFSPCQTLLVFAVWCFFVDPSFLISLFGCDEIFVMDNAGLSHFVLKRIVCCEAVRAQEFHWSQGTTQVSTMSSEFVMLVLIAAVASSFVPCREYSSFTKFKLCVRFCNYHVSLWLWFLLTHVHLYSTTRLLDRKLLRLM